MSTASPHPRRRLSPRSRSSSSSSVWIWFGGVLPLAVALAWVGYQAHILRERVDEMETRLAAPSAGAVVDTGTGGDAGAAVADLRAEVEKIRGMVRRADETAIAEAVDEVERRIMQRLRERIVAGLDELKENLDHALEVQPDGLPRWMHDLRDAVRKGYQPPTLAPVSAEDLRIRDERLEKLAHEKAEWAEREATRWTTAKIDSFRHIVPHLPSWLASEDAWREFHELEWKAYELTYSSRTEYDRVEKACEECLAALNRILPKGVRHLTVRDLPRMYLPDDIYRALRKFKEARKIRISDRK